MYDPDVEAMELEFNERLAEKTRYIEFLETALMNAAGAVDEHQQSLEFDDGEYLLKEQVMEILEDIRASM